MGQALSLSMRSQPSRVLRRMAWGSLVGVLRRNLLFSDCLGEILKCTEEDMGISTSYIMAAE